MVNNSSAIYYEKKEKLKKKIRERCENLTEKNMKWYNVVLKDIGRLVRKN